MHGQQQLQHLLHPRAPQALCSAGDRSPTVEPDRRWRAAFRRPPAEAAACRPLHIEPPLRECEHGDPAGRKPDLIAHVGNARTFRWNRGQISRPSYQGRASEQNLARLLLTQARSELPVGQSMRILQLAPRHRAELCEDTVNKRTLTEHSAHRRRRLLREGDVSVVVGLGDVHITAGYGDSICNSNI